MSEGKLQLVTVERGGAIVIPKDIMERMGLSPGGEVILALEEGGISIRAVKTRSPVAGSPPKG